MYRPDRPGQQAGEADVEVESARPHQLAGGNRLGNAFFRQPDVPPAGETVLQVPLRLAVTEQDQGRHQASTFSIVMARSAAAFFSSARMAWSASRQEAAKYFDRSGDHP